MSGIVIGSIVPFIILSIMIIFIEEYITFMNMDINIYKNFTIYSIIQLFIQLIFSFIIEKLYYENNTKLANRYTVIFNIINFFTLITLSLLLKNEIIIIVITLISILIYTIYIIYKNYDKFKLKLNLVNCIKYDSSDLISRVSYLLIYLIGLKIIFEFGEQYALAITFAALITDTQWDFFDAIATVAKIDIVKDEFNYKIHIKNAYKLLTLILFSIIILFVCLQGLYELNIKITAIYVLAEVINFVIYPIYRIKLCFIQLKYSPIAASTNRVIANLIRLSTSFIKSPFCTVIG